MDLREPKLSSPVVTSLSAASQQFNHWVAENNIKEIVDYSGLRWLMIIQLSLKDPSASLPWQLKISFETDVNQKILLEHEVLDWEQADDRRLLELIGDENIKLHVKPKFFSLRDEEDAKNTLLEQLPILRKSFHYNKMPTIVRGLLGEWLDLSRKFVIGK